MDCKIEHSKKGPYYELTINGKFAGNYDTMQEAAHEFDLIVLEEKEGDNSYE